MQFSKDDIPCTWLVMLLEVKCEASPCSRYSFINMPLNSATHYTRLFAQLYDSQDHKEPIATYNLSRKPESPIVIQFICGHPALTSHMLEILLSFVVIEGKIRSQEKVDHILLAFAREEAAYLIY